MAVSEYGHIGGFMITQSNERTNYRYLFYLQLVNITPISFKINCGFDCRDISSLVRCILGENQQDQQRNRSNASVFLQCVKHIMSFCIWKLFFVLDYGFSWRVRVALGGKQITPLFCLAKIVWCHTVKYQSILEKNLSRNQYKYLSAQWALHWVFGDTLALLWRWMY